MSNESVKIGSVGWLDLTVENAEEVRGFYQAVVGSQVESVSMGEYDDYTLHPSSGGPPVAGVCHARGANAGLPPQWLPYFVVADLAASLDEVAARGGEILGEARGGPGEARYCLIRDPGGACCMLYQAA